MVVEPLTFKRLGIAEEMKDKARMIPAEPVAAVVARGEAELGFQQISELLPVPGADLVGPLPTEMQKITIFSASITTNARQSDAGKVLIAFLASAAAVPALTKAGLEPFASSAKQTSADRQQRLHFWTGVPSSEISTRFLLGIHALSLAVC